MYHPDGNHYREKNNLERLMSDYRHRFQGFENQFPLQIWIPGVGELVSVTDTDPRGCGTIFRCCYRFSGTQVWALQVFFFELQEQILTFLEFILS